MDPAALAVLGAISFAVIVALARDAITSALKAFWRKVRPKTETPTPDRKAEAIGAVRLNVASTNKRLRDIIAHVVGGNFTSPELRAALDETRGEFMRHRSFWVIVGDSDLLQGIEHWHDEIRNTKDDISNEERAWLQFINTSRSIRRR